MQIKINKRADISIVVLVIGIIAVCFLSIFSFVKSNENINEDFLGIGLIETMNSVEEEFNFYAEKNEFSGDYEDFENIEIESFPGIIKIKINDENMQGVYIAKETYFLNLFYTGEKIMIKVNYNR